MFIEQRTVEIISPQPTVTWEVMLQYFPQSPYPVMILNRVVQNFGVGCGSILLRKWVLHVLIQKLPSKYVPQMMYCGRAAFNATQYTYS